MDEKSLRVLIEASSVKQMLIIGDGALFHVDVVTMTMGAITALTRKGTVKTWATLDAAARWIRSLGIRKAQLDIARWDTRHSRRAFTRCRVFFRLMFPYYRDPSAVYLSEMDYPWIERLNKGEGVHDVSSHS